MSVEALEFVVIVLASLLIIGIVIELAKWTLNREAERIDRYNREVIRRRYGKPPR